MTLAETIPPVKSNVTTYKGFTRPIRPAAPFSPVSPADSIANFSPIPLAMGYSAIKKHQRLQEGPLLWQICCLAIGIVIYVREC